MTPPGLLSLSRWQRFCLLFGLWTVLGLIDAGQFFVHLNYFRRTSIYWEEALASGLADWYVWGILAPFIYQLGRMFPLDNAHWRRRLCLHLVAGTGFMLLKAAIDMPLAVLIHGRTVLQGPMLTDFSYAGVITYFLESYKAYVIVKFFAYLIVYSVIVAVAHILDYYEKYRDRELRASKLKAQLAQTQLQVLRMQLQPHFLFNTLNAIAALMHRDLRLADRMIARLGELLRATLDDTGTQEVPLRRELEFLTPYLEIEQARLGSRLAVHADVDPEVLDARLPYLILQPLVENAIRHGLAQQPGQGRLEVRVRRRSRQLVLEVRDNGPGMPPGRRFAEGIGLSNTRARLRGLYGDEQSLVLRNGSRGGLVVTVALPYREDWDIPDPRMVHQLEESAV